jgi:bisphosphoglycerate-independent phosphoglycerate mutase (AlkP superfamily)
MNRPINTERPNLLDMAPTILDAFGVPQNTAMEGESLLL